MSQPEFKSLSNVMAEALQEETILELARGMLRARMNHGEGVAIPADWHREAESCVEEFIKQLKQYDRNQC